MRKVFWCCTAAAVLAAGSVYLAAKHIDRHPYEALASILGGAAASGSCPANPSEEPPPAEPTPVDPSPSAEAPTMTGTVVVRSEDNPISDITVGEGSVPMPTCKDSAEAGTATIDASSLSGSVGTAPKTPCPTIMPYCPDDSEASNRRMPYADEEQCEESCESFIGIWLGMVEQMSNEMALSAEEPRDAAPAGEEMPAGKCQEDQHYHQQYPSCPYTGRCYPPTYVPCPSVPDAEQKKTDDSDKKSDAEMPKMKGATEEQELPPPLTDLDTMEFRPSDAGLHALHPRSAVSTCSCLAFRQRQQGRRHALPFCRSGFCQGGLPLFCGTGRPPSTYQSR